jgi:hypothetical protein
MGRSSTLRPVRQGGSFSPDGTALIFESFGGAESRIEVSRVDGSNRTVITSARGHNEYLDGQPVP